MDLETCLAQVRLEEASLEPKAFCMQQQQHESSDDSESPDAELKTSKQFSRLLQIDSEYQKLTSCMQLTPQELQYFRSLKQHVAETYHKSEPPEESAFWRLAKGNCKNDAEINDQDVWKSLFAYTSAPQISQICEGGVSFRTLQDALHALADCVCQEPNLPLSDGLLKWIFVLLVILDPLHAMSESVAYELQRVRRTLLRKYSNKQVDHDSQLASLAMLSSLIAQEFNQR